MPGLRAVASTTSPPGLRSPRFSASRIIHLPARSFTDWPGFMNSALPKMVQPVASEARFSLMSGVLPMASTTSLLKVISGDPPVFPHVPKQQACALVPANVVNEGGQHKPTKCLELKCLALPRFCEHHLPDVDIP